EDGIRDRNVTGVQTCALPIFRCSTVAPRLVICQPAGLMLLVLHDGPTREVHVAAQLPHRCRDSTIRCSIPVLNIARVVFTIVRRSEERRVGKECRVGWEGCSV